MTATMENPSKIEKPGIAATASGAGPASGRGAFLTQAPQRGIKRELNTLWRLRISDGVTSGSHFAWLEVSHA